MGRGGGRVDLLGCEGRGGAVPLPRCLRGKVRATRGRKVVRGASVWTGGRRGRGARLFLGGKERGNLFDRKRGRKSKDPLTEVVEVVRTRMLGPRGVGGPGCLLVPPRGRYAVLWRGSSERGAGAALGPPWTPPGQGGVWRVVVEADSVRSCRNGEGNVSRGRVDSFGSFGVVACGRVVEADRGSWLLACRLRGATSL